MHVSTVVLGESCRNTLATIDSNFCICVMIFFIRVVERKFSIFFWFMLATPIDPTIPFGVSFQVYKTSSDGFGLEPGV
jgi:hypothetical protein